MPPPDECAKDPCHEFADCTNVGSTYSCACKDGYMGDGVFCMGMIVIGFQNIWWMLLFQSYYFLCIIIIT